MQYPTLTPRGIIPPVPVHVPKMPGHAMHRQLLRSKPMFHALQTHSQAFTYPVLFSLMVHSVPYKVTGVERVKVTGVPVILTQIVKGSLPICSVVKPAVLVTDPGTVTGMVVGQVLPLVEMLMPVMVAALVELPERMYDI